MSGASGPPPTSVPARQGVPGYVVALIAAFAVAAAAVTVAAAALDPSMRTSWPAVPGLLAALVAGAYLHVDFRYGDDDVNALDLFEVALAPTILALPPTTAVVVACGTKAAAEVAMRVQPIKAAYNVAAWGLSVAAAAIVMALFDPHGPGGWWPLGPLAVAMVWLMVVNNATFVALLCVTGRQSVRRSLQQLQPAVVPGWLVGGGVTLAIGIVLAAAYDAEPLTAWLFAVPLLALHWAARGYARSRADLARVEGLHRATGILAAPTLSDQALDAFLDEVRTAFVAPAARLVVIDDGGVRDRQVGDDGREASVSADVVVGQVTAMTAATSLSPTDGPLGPELLGRRWRRALVAPVRGLTGTAGALVVCDPGGGFRVDDADLAVLDAFAREVAAAFERASAAQALQRSEARFRALVQRSSDLVVLLDGAGTTTDVAVTQRPPHPATATPTVGRPAVEAAHPDDRARLAECLASVAGRAGAVETITWRARAADGSWRNLETVATNLLDDPAVAGVVLNSRDVTEREHAAALMARQAKALAAIARQDPIEGSLEAVAETVTEELEGARYTVVLTDRTGISASLGTGLPGPLVEQVVALLAPPTAEAPEELIVADVAADPLWASVAAGSGVQALWATPVRTSDNTAVLGAAVISFAAPRAPEPGDWRVAQLAVQLTQIAVERASVQARLLHQATHDTLTGLPNRRLFLDRTAVALNRITRTGRSLAVLFVDLDGFKVVNDSLGHDAGDALLIRLAERVRNVMRPSDTVARFGGDEFTILCEDIHDRDEATVIATRVREALAEPVSTAGRQISVTASVGIAYTSTSDSDPFELLENADAAMYRSKQGGGNQHKVFDPSMRTQSLAALSTTEGLRRALERDELRVYYQPVVDLDTQRTVGAEALLRWHHPDLGVLLPGQFVPIAEQTGLIIPIGTLVLEEACRQARQWQPRHGRFTMSVNVSARQIVASDFSERVLAALSRSGTPPHALSLEMTETVLMESGEIAVSNLRQLTDVGVQLAIDDFGTGYSSLSYLKRFPVDILKIDRAFVAGLGQQADDEAIVAAVVQMARNLGVLSVAEGVETAEQIEVLRRFGCQLAQGFYFNRPVPPERFRPQAAAT